MMKKTKLDFGEAREDRFMLPGIDFKAKMIGIEPVGEARGDKMCMEAMIKLKYLVKTSGEHKARIVVNVSIEGIRILDEKTREVLHQHEVHRISFISRDSTDPRAFGYVYGEQGNHKFFGIKTEKQADALVLTLKDLFEVVLELKKQQIVEQKKAEQLTQSTPKEQENSEPKQIASFKNPPPAEGGEVENDADPIYAQVNKPKLTELAANLNEQSPPSSGLLDLEQEVKNLQMGIDNMEEFDLHPQSPTSQQTQPDQFATPASSDPFALAGPPAMTQKAPAASSNLDSAFGASDPFKVQATPTAVVNSAAPPPATSTPSNDLFKEFKDTFTAPAPQPVNAFVGVAMSQGAPNPFGGMQTAPAPFQANFGGMGAPAAFGGMGAPAAFGGAPAAFGGAPAAYGAPAGFGAPPAAQPPADPFSGSDMFGDSVLQPEATAAAAALNNTQPAKSDPFSDIGALGSSKADAPKSTKDMFANYKIGKPGEAQPAPEIKLTGGPKRPPPAIPTSPQSSMCAALVPPSSLKLRKSHTQEQGHFDMPSPQGPPPPLPPDSTDIKKQDRFEVPVNVPFAPKPEPNKDHDLSLPSPTNSPPPLPTYMNINDIHVHASVPLPEINFNSNSPPPPPPPRSRPGQLRLSTSNPLPVPPRNRTKSSQSSPPHSPHSETASVKSCDARFFSATSPIPNRVSSPSIVSTCSALSTLDETQGEDNSSGITSNSAPSHSNSMNSLSSVFDSNNVSTDTFDNESNNASPSPSPIASSMCHDSSTTRAIDIIPSHFASASQPKGPCSTSQDSLYSSVETLSPSSTQSTLPSFTSNQNSSHHTRSTSHVTSSSTSVYSTSAPVTQDSLSVGKSHSLHSLSPLTLPQLPIHDDPFADDPFSRHSPSVKKTFVLNSFADFSSSASTTTDTVSPSQNIENVWSSHTITNMNNDLPSDVVINSDPFGAPVTNGNSGNNLFGNQFDTFDFSTN